MRRRGLPPIALLTFAVAVAAGVSRPRAETDPGIPPNMTTYFFGVLVKGPKWSPEATPERAAIMEGHLAPLTAMNKAGKLVLAGPLMDGGDWRGILIYRTKTIEEAQKLADDDPAVKAGRLQVAMLPWMVQKGILPDPLLEK